jgi:Family of unknown function (DUF6270)
MSITASPVPSVVAIAGSCPTRDNFNSRFNPGYRRWFTCDLASNQTSMIAQMSPPIEVSWQPLKAMSDYDRWNIGSDLSREFLGLLAVQQPTYLILDFFADVHFGVARVADGRYLTDNRWKIQQTDWYRTQSEQGAFEQLTLQDDTEEYLKLWREAMDRFAAYLAEHSPDTIVIVHRGWNTGLVRVEGHGRPMPLNRYKPIRHFDVEGGNELWAMLDDYCVERFGWDTIDLRDEAFTTYPEHPWGPFWVHYEPEYYHRFLAELHKIHLRHSGVDADLQDRVQEIEEAAREAGDRRWRHAQALADSRGEIVARQKERIEELESLGVGRAVKFALGQRLRARRAIDEEEAQP